MYVRSLESRPNHPLRLRHAADLHVWLSSRMLWNRQWRFRRALRACHRIRQTAGPRVAELLDGPPLARAEIAGLAIDAFRVVAGVLVQGDGGGEVRAADYVAAVSAVVFAEVPGEG